jgi:hypothetical protein
MGGLMERQGEIIALLKAAGCADPEIKRDGARTTISAGMGGRRYTWMTIAENVDYGMAERGARFVIERLRELNAGD